MVKEAFQLVFYLYQLFLCEINKRIQKLDEQEPIHFKVEGMEAEGRGKIRYIGGWAIRKSLEKSLRYVMENQQSDSTDVLRCVTREIQKVNLSQNNVIFPFLSKHVEIYTKTISRLRLGDYKPIFIGGVGGGGQGGELPP